MASSIIYSQGSATVLVPAGGSVAVFPQNGAVVFQLGLYPNQPPTANQIGTVLAGGQTVFGPFASGATLRIDGGAGITRYAVGSSPAIVERGGYRFQAAPVAVNVTGAVSAAAILGGIVTSTTAAAVAGTVPTGAVLDAASQLAIGDAVEWSVINTGANAFTVTAATGHTIVGAAAVATATSGRFATVKTAAATYVTYRLS